MLDLYAKILERLMVDELYPATLVGLSYKIRACSIGLLVEVDGFTPKLSLLAQAISKYIPNSRNLLTKSLFETTRKELFKWYNMTMTLVSKLTDDLRLSILRPGHWTAIEKHASLFSIEFDKFQHFMNQFVDHVYIKCLVQGNITEANATETGRKIVELSKCGCLLPNTMPQCRINEIPRGRSCCRVEAFGSQLQWSFSKNYYQFDDSTIKLGVIIDLLIVVMSDDRFSKLIEIGLKHKWPICQTEKDSFGVNNYTLSLQDYFISMADIERMASWEQKFGETLEFIGKFSQEFTDDEWKCAKEIFIASKRETNLRLDFSRNWAEIIMGDYAFDKQSRELDVISGLELDAFRKMMSNITEDGFNVRKLSVQVISSKRIQVNSSSVKAKPSSSTTGTKSQNIPPLQLEYLTKYPNEKERMPCYYITDIEKYRSGLKVLPNKNVTIK